MCKENAPKQRDRVSEIYFRFYFKWNNACIGLLYISDYNSIKLWNIMQQLQLNIFMCINTCTCERVFPEVISKATTKLFPRMY